MAHLGSRGFDTISGEVVSTTAFTLLAARLPSYQGAYLRLVEGRSESEKSTLAKNAILGRGENFFRFSTNEINKVPGQPIAYWLSAPMVAAFQVGEPVSSSIGLKAGLSTGDNTIFQRLWHEVNLEDSSLGSLHNGEPIRSDRKWFPCHSGGQYRKWYGNHEVVLNWENDGLEVRNFGADGGRVRSAIRNDSFYFREGLTWSKISSGRFDARFRPRGFLFDDTGRSGFGDNSKTELGCLAMFCSTVANEMLSILCPSMSFTSTELGMLPFATGASDLSVSGAKEMISLARSDWDAYETSWDFTTLPLLHPDHRADRGIAFGFVGSHRDRKSSSPDYERNERAKKFFLCSPF